MSRGVDVDHADHVVAALHRHADRLADAHLQDARGRVPAVVVAGVAGEHAFVALDDVIENRLADRDPLVGWQRPAVAAHLGHAARSVSGSFSMMQPRSASTHSKIISMIRCSSWSMSSVWLTASAVRYMICRLLRARASQGLCGFVAGVEQNLAPFRLAASSGRSASRRSSSAATDDVDFVGEVFDGRPSVDARVEQQRAAELHLVAAGESLFADLLAVDERAVGAAEVADEDASAVAAPDFGMLARDFGVVQLHGVRRAAPDRDDVLEPAKRVP